MSTLKLGLFIGVLGMFMMFGGVSAVYGQADQPTLKYPIGIDTSDGFWELVAAAKPLPLVYSESFSNYKDDQKTVQIALSQKTPEGLEKIIVVDVEIPPRPKATVRVLITLKIDKNKNLTVKSSVMETGAVKTFGPVPVE